MQQIEIDQLPEQIHALIASLASGEEIIITQAEQPVAKLVRYEPEKRWRKAGSAKGQIVIAPDFDEPLADFQEYQ